MESGNRTRYSFPAGLSARYTSGPSEDPRGGKRKNMPSASDPCSTTKFSDGGRSGWSPGRGSVGRGGLGRVRLSSSAPSVRQDLFAAWNTVLKIGFIPRKIPFFLDALRD